MNTTEERKIAKIDLHRFYRKSETERKEIVFKTSDEELKRIIESDFDFLGKDLFIAQGEKRGIVEKGECFSMY